MHTFIQVKSRRREWIWWLASGPLTCAQFIDGAWSALHRAPGAARILGVVAAVLLAFSVGAAYSWISSHAVIEADNRTLTYRSRLKTHTIAWGDVVKIAESSGTPPSRVTFTDSRGTSITLLFSRLVDGSELRAITEDLLAPVRELNVAGFTKQAPAGQTDQQTAGYVLAGFSILFLLIAVALPFLPNGRDTGLSIVFALLGGGLLLLSLYSVTLKIDIADGALVAASCYSRKRIALDRIESVYFFPGKGCKVMVVRSGARKISVASNRPKYHEIEAAVEAHRPANAEAASKIDREKFINIQVRSFVVIMSICTIYLAGMGIYMGWNMMHKVQRVNLLRAHGVTGSGHVIGDVCGGCSRGISDIRYEFHVDGVRCEGLNHQTAATAGIRLNDNATIRYLPDDPSVNLLETRLDWQPMVLQSIIPLTVCLCSPLCIPFLARRIRSQVTMNSKS